MGTLTTTYTLANDIFLDGAHVQQNLDDVKAYLNGEGVGIEAANLNASAKFQPSQLAESYNAIGSIGLLVSGYTAPSDPADGATTIQFRPPVDVTLFMVTARFAKTAGGSASSATVTVANGGNLVWSHTFNDEDATAAGGIVQCNFSIPAGSKITVSCPVSGLTNLDAVSVHAYYKAQHTEK